MSENLKQIAVRLKELREIYNYSEEETALKLGISKDQTLKEGNIIGYYRVDALGPNHMLLYSKLHAPGEGWMEWRVEESVLMQTAFFAPRGLPGFLYWYLLSPFHRLVFRGLIQAIKKRSETQ